MSIRRLTVEYPGGRKALQEITLEIDRGELTVLLGRSGAGKSTLLRRLSLLRKPTAGTIGVEGFGEITARARLRDYRRQAGMGFQLHHLIGRRSALRNVLMGRPAYHSTLPALRSLLPFPREMSNPP
ncbi:MAG: ATP-binding cassette domain-containing protein [Desulfobacterales bacterium]